MFIQGKVAITAAGITDEKDLTPDTNVMFIRPKMDYGTRNKVVGAAARLKAAAAKAPKRRRAKTGENDVEFDVGAYQTALLQFNVIGWNGPAFVGVPCTPENIARLDPDELLVQKVVEEITNRNTKADAEGDEPAELDDPNVIDLTSETTIAS